MNSDAFKDRLLEVLGGEKTYSFAKKSGITESLLRKYLTGDSLPGLDRLIIIAEKGKVNIEWLATGEGPKEKGSPKEALAPIVREEHDLYRVKNITEIQELFGKSVGYLREIFDSNDPIFISAIQANLHSFSRAIRREKEISQLSEKINDLEKKITDINKLNELFEDYMRPRPDGPERRKHILATTELKVGNDTNGMKRDAK